MQDQLEAEFQQLKKQMAPKIVINSPSSQQANGQLSDGGGGAALSNGDVQSNGHAVQAFRDQETQDAFDLLEEMSKNEKG